MTSPTGSVDGQIDAILMKAFNEYYDYITEKDIIKAANEYSEKTSYNNAKSALKQLILAREEALQKRFKKQRELERAGDRAIIKQLQIQLQSLPNTTKEG